MNFKDHFSGQAQEYATYRPHYPEALFAFLASAVDAHDLAWDCATGNGQAALGLVPYFEHIIATDPSDNQLANARKHAKISYRVASAENTDIETGSVDLITVAQALHWFDIDKFYDEVRRVLKPDGLLAVWGYNLLQCNPQIDALLDTFYTELVGPYWPPERAHVEENYRSIFFPFREVPVPAFFMETRWDVDELLGYLATWSATQRFIKARGSDPIDLIEDELRRLWGEPGTLRKIKWPLFLRAGRPLSS